MVEWYIIKAEEHLQKVALHQRDWNTIIPTSPLAYMATNHNTKG
jgi:hypothetical protein